MALALEIKRNEKKRKADEKKQIESTKSKVGLEDRIDFPAGQTVRRATTESCSKHVQLQVQDLSY